MRIVREVKDNEADVDLKRSILLGYSDGMRMTAWPALTLQQNHVVISTQAQRTHEA
jgi:predicted esterase